MDLTSNSETAHALAVLIAKLANRPFTCSMASRAAHEILGGTIKGYWADENPTATLGQAEGGHDFLIVDQSYILDIWAMAYYGESLFLDLVEDEQEIKRLYGDASLWRTVNLSERVDGEQECGCVYSLTGDALFLCPRHL